MTRDRDLLQELAKIPADSALAAARATRDAATKHTQGSYEVLFNDSSTDFPLPQRAALAQQIARWHGEEKLAEHYQRLAAAPRQDATFAAALAHAERLTFTPASAGPDDLHTLQQAGWQSESIVTLSQLIAFVSFQSRLLSGFRLLSGTSPSQNNDTAATAGDWRTEPLTLSGKRAPAAFTQDELHWEPWLAAKPLDEFTLPEQAVLEKFGHSQSDYFRLLARNLPLLEQRTLTDKGIFYTAGGLPRKERELAATVTSKVNGCIYCASVHARKAAQLSKQPQDIQRLLDVSPGASLTANQNDRWRAIIDFAAALSVTPPAASTKHLTLLQAQNLTELERVDLIQSTAFFAWANRLMLTLGEPSVPGIP